ncbi:hypothetical protein ACP4OV_031086 [Aristida adscensionis]
MAVATAASSDGVQRALQTVAQNTGWTYSLLWKLCPHQGALVWAEGHYNGAIKTRKTVQPGGDDGGAGGAGEEAAAARHRSRQLRELYDSLAGEAAGGGGGGAGGATAAARRPSAALAPEDLTETEWFYLMCASYCFPPGLGLPGRAFAKRGHVWLSGANHVDSKVFSRAILAKSAGIQTVACISVVDGILEIGTTEKVEEDTGLIQYVRSIFMDQYSIHMMTTLSKHSTSNPITLTNLNSFEIKREKYIGVTNVEINNLSSDYENNEMEGDDNGIDTEYGSHSETNTANESCHRGSPNNLSNDHTPKAGSSELMQVEIPEMPQDSCSRNLDEEIKMLLICLNNNAQSDMQGHDETSQRNLVYEDLCGGYTQSSAEDQAMLPENAHYAETVLTILRYNARRQTQPASNKTPYLAVSNSSPFARWNPKRSDDLQGTTIYKGTPQRMLKCILLITGPVRSSTQCMQGGEAALSGDGDRARRGQVQAELSGSHVLKERRRREKLNERFIVLRSLVPFVTKMDRASILGDTIEYVKQLRRRIHDLESSSSSRPHHHLHQQIAGDLTTTQQATPAEARRKLMTMRPTTVEASGSSSCSSATGRPPAAATAAVGSTEVQASIAGGDVQVELRCPHRDGLLLRVMQALRRELRLDVADVRASSAGGVLLAELRAKVMEVDGRRSSITDVKRAIQLVLNSD